VRFQRGNLTGLFVWLKSLQEGLANAPDYVWFVGVAFAAWIGYGMWKLYLIGGNYLRLDIPCLWPFLLLISLFAIVWARSENRE
jgi:hypothetical protein